MNRITIKGRVGRVDEAFVTPKGHIKATFSIADNASKEGPSWYEVEAWEHLAYRALALKKGVLIEIEGYIKKIDAYIDKDKKAQPKIIVVLGDIVKAVDLDAILTFKDPVETEFTVESILSTGQQ